MVKPTAQSGSAIEKLLQDRTQYEQWLAKLASAGNAPDAVRQRVRADYEARLKGVLEELRGHGDTINADLERFRASEADLVRRQSAAEERIAEAEIRHAVGEFEESKWQEIREEAGRGLAEAQEELTQVRAEIGRLAEVQRAIAAPAAAPPAAMPQPPTPPSATPPARAAAPPPPPARLSRRSSSSP